MTLHLELGERIEEEFGERLESFPELRQDAVLLALDGGVALEIRYAGPDEYAFNWVWRDAALRIDTAPLHPGLATSPNHLHGAGGEVRADPLTRPGRDPWENVRAVIAALLADPLLGEAS